MGIPGSPVVRTLLSLPRVQVQSLARELRSHKPSSMTKKKKGGGVWGTEKKSLKKNEHHQ